MTTLFSYLCFILFGYLSGSVLYAYWIPKYICHVDTVKLSMDQNPGAFNAFQYAGWKIGLLSIILDVLKGFFPVFLASRYLDTNGILFGVVLAAPVIGHALPIWNISSGGKAIAVSFGSLLGLFPNLSPVIFLAVFYLLFSFIIVIGPHLHRSIASYTCFLLINIFTTSKPSVLLGNALISCIVILKHLLKYKKEPVSIRLLGH